MNNEEKILNILENMQGQMDSMGKHIDSMESRMDSMESRMDRMEETLTRVALTQENVVLPRLQLLAEGHSDVVRMMAKQEDLEVVKEDVRTLTSAVRTHAVDIADLKAVK